MRKKFEILVHYDVCFTVQIEGTNVTKAIKRAVNDTAKKDLNGGEIVNVEAFVNKIAEAEG